MVENYRPVSIVSSLSKVFEKCLMDKLGKMFDCDDLMGAHQQAFRPGSSTITAGLSIQDFIARQMDDGSKVLLYSTDLTAAFDLLRPNQMVKSMLDIGIPKTYIRITLDFLSKRLGYVMVGNHNSDIFKIPMGCVQGSVLGPFLFNMYTKQLEKIILQVAPEAFVCSYADDAYVAIPFLNRNIHQMLEWGSYVIKKHQQWLSSIGMHSNEQKTESVIFGHDGPPCSMMVGNSRVQIKDDMNILGITFEKNLKWGVHAAKVLKKANSMSYTLKLLNQKLSRPLHKMIIHAHFLSHIQYGFPIWAGNLSSLNINRFNKIIFKVLRLHTFDRERSLTNRELCERSGTRNFQSMSILNDTIMLHRLCCNPMNTIITTRLIEQTFTLSRFPARIHFYDTSKRRVGRTSFINRAKKIAESIPFPWPDLSYHVFKTRIKSCVPLLALSDEQIRTEIGLHSEPKLKAKC